MDKTVGIQVTGKVQGVYFRKYTQEKARELALSGWVKNKRDGSVEIAATGPEAAVNQLIEFCHVGSPAADVESVRVNPRKETDLAPEFEIRATE